MKDINRMMIAFDLSDMDKQLLKYTNNLIQFLGIEKIYMLHVMPDMALPSNQDLEFHKLFSSKYPVDEKVKDKITMDIAEALPIEKAFDLDIHVVEGQPYQKLLQWMDLKEVDLIVVGQKRKSGGSGITAKRVARHAHCNILFVPEQVKPEIRRILVPIDFSNCSAKALRTAIECKHNAWDETEVIGLHVMDLPPVDYMGQPLLNGDGFKKVLESSAHDAYRSMMEKWDLDPKEVQFVNTENCCNNTALGILEYAKVNNADLIMMGAQGHSALNNFFFGSVTEKLVDRNTEKPVLIIR